MNRLGPRFALKCVFCIVSLRFAKRIARVPISAQKLHVPASFPCRAAPASRVARETASHVPIAAQHCYPN